jgi:hypothetical protein
MVSAEALARATQIIDGLSDEELQRLERGEIVPGEVAFVQSLQIEDKVTGGLIRFILWDCQRDLLEFVAANDRAFILKARQLGITWTVLAHLLYLANYWGDRLILLASQTGDDAAATLQRLRRLHASIPAELHPQKLIKDNTTQIRFANHSRFEVVKATKRAGRSKAAYATLLDELAFLDWPPAQLSALDAASERLYATTTGNGPGDLAHSIWRQAQEGTGRWRAVFYPWSAHPGRVTDPDWYRKNVTESPEPRLALREYAATPEQAFAAPEGIYFERWDPKRNAPYLLRPALNWETRRAVDFGFHNPACLWVQISPKGQFCVVSELAQREPFNWTTEEFAEAILERDRELHLAVPISGTFCDPAGKSVEATTGISEFDLFASKGLAPSGEVSSVRDGCVRLMDNIADPTLPLLVNRSCEWLVEALGSVPPDRNHPDVYDRSTPYAHVLDALRYFMINQSAGEYAYIPIDYDEFPTPGGGIFGIY